MDDKEALLRVIERSDRILDAATKIGVAYVGYKAADHPSGALAGLVALKLANANNLAAGVAGVATLTALGITSVAKQQFQYGPFATVPRNEEDLIPHSYAYWGMGGL